MSSKTSRIGLVCITLFWAWNVTLGLMSTYAVFYMLTQYDNRVDLLADSVPVIGLLLAWIAGGIFFGLACLIHTRKPQVAA